MLLTRLTDYLWWLSQLGFTVFIQCLTLCQCGQSKAVIVQYQLTMKVDKTDSS